jgi:hypothetical protein
VHHDIRSFIAKHSLQTPALNVHLVKAGGSIDVPAFSRREIIDNDRLMSFHDQPINQMRPDETCAARH